MKLWVLPKMTPFHTLLKKKEKSKKRSRFERHCSLLPLDAQKIGEEEGFVPLYFFIRGRPPVSIQASGILGSASFSVLGERERRDVCEKR